MGTTVVDDGVHIDRLCVRRKGAQKQSNIIVVNEIEAVEII